LEAIMRTRWRLAVESTYDYRTTDGRVRTTGIRALRVSLGLAVVGLLAVACSDGGEPAPTTPPVPSSPATTSADPVTAAEEAALAAYEGMWRAFSAASQAADPEHPDLSRFAEGDALALLVSGLEANRREGLVSEGGEVLLYPEVASAEPVDAPVEVEIRDCADTSQTRRVRPSGPPFTDEPGGWRQVAATVRLVEPQVWKVTDLTVQEVGSCGPES
jgi:hypothetical protein